MQIRGHAFAFDRYGRTACLPPAARCPPTPVPSLRGFYVEKRKAVPTSPCRCHRPCPPRGSAPRSRLSDPSDAPSCFLAGRRAASPAQSGTVSELRGHIEVLAASPEEFSSGNSFPGSTPSAPRTQKERRFAPARTDPYVCGRAARHAPAARGVAEETETQRKGESEMGKAEQ